MMEAPVTVCIPTFNRWDALRRALPAYLAQDQVGPVVVLVDGAGDDTAAGLRREFGSVGPRLRVLRNTRNTGLCAARNRLVRSVETPYLFMGEDDVWLPPGLIRRLLEVVEADGLDGACSRIRYAEWADAGRPIAPAPRRGERPDVWSDAEVVALDLDLDTGGPVRVRHMMAVALLRTALVRELGYDERLRRYRDETDFYLRAGVRGARFGYVPDVCALHMTAPVQGARRGGCHAGGGLAVEVAKIADHARFLRRHLRGLSAERGKRYRPVYYPLRYAWHHLAHKYWGLAPVCERPGATVWAKRRHFAVEVAQRLLPPTVYRAVRRLLR